MKSIEAIDQTLDIITGLQKHNRRLSKLGLVASAENPELELCYHRLHNYRRNLVALTDFQQGASTLVKTKTFKNYVLIANMMLSLTSS